MGKTRMLNRPRRAGLLAAVLCLFLPVLSQAQDKPVTAANGWVKLPADGETSTIAFAAVNNPGMYDIYLLSGTTDVAEKVELRDAKKGAAAVDEIPVTHYETMFMEPAGAYLYLSGLKRPLKEGETVTIALKTDTGEVVNVEAQVKKDAPK